MDELGRSPDQPEPYRPEFRDPSAAWRWWGFLLIVLGSAGILFHQVRDMELLATREGKAALGAVALGLILVIVGFLKRRS